MGLESGTQAKYEALLKNGVIVRAAPWTLVRGCNTPVRIIIRVDSPLYHILAENERIDHLEIQVQVFHTYLIKQFRRYRIRERNISYYTK